ncbi:hypothetical protein AB0L00_19755 [Actinoallomurus sp. NPDC052308]|uniref:hypothetical protein n=1 Tax=Actinoallomurus sp. NPDC052308 TaxID=3155530 RepID=UPI0034375F7D
MSKGVRKLLEMGVAVVVIGACCAGLFVLYKALGISISDDRAFGLIVAPALAVGTAAQYGTRRWLRQRYAPEEMLVKINK